MAVSGLAAAVVVTLSAVATIVVLIGMAVMRLWG
jgi:hypothetical protein